MNYPGQVKEWKDAYINANDETKARNRKVSKALREERSAKEKLEKEPARKEKSLVEAVVLLLLRKKRIGFRDGRRGRMNSAADRRQAVELIGEAVDADTPLYKACVEIGIHKRTYNRWKDTYSDYVNKRTICEHPEVVNTLSQKEKKDIWSG